jgi:large subunit ribosomal protein L22
MATAKATLGNFRQAPRKMRQVVNAVRGKKVTEALVNLDFITKKASAPVKALILSAIANAKAQDIPTENLIVKTIMVNGGSILYRRRPAARGSAHPIRKRTSSVFVELGEPTAKVKKTKVVKEVEASKQEKKQVEKKAEKSKAPRSVRAKKESK